MKLILVLAMLAGFPAASFALGCGACAPSGPSYQAGMCVPVEGTGQLCMITNDGLCWQISHPSCDPNSTERAQEAEPQQPEIRYERERLQGGWLVTLYVNGEVYETRWVADRTWGKLKVQYR